MTIDCPWCEDTVWTQSPALELVSREGSAGTASVTWSKDPAPRNALS